MRSCSLHIGSCDVSMLHIVNVPDKCYMRHPRQYVVAYSCIYVKTEVDRVCVCVCVFLLCLQWSCGPCRDDVAARSERIAMGASLMSGSDTEDDSWSMGATDRSSPGGARMVSE